MSWCPNCKTEYRKGVTVCADCGSGLVDEQPAEYNYVPLKVIEMQEIADKLIQYLNYSNLDSHYEYSEEELGYVILVRDEELKKAQKAFLAFYEVELNQAQANQPASNATQTSETNNDEEDLYSDSEEDIDKASDGDSLEQEKRKVTKMMYSSGAYESKREKAKEMKSTAATFFTFGILGLVFVGLNLVKVINLINGVIPYVVMSSMFLGFILVGVNSVGRAKKAAEESIQEEETTKKITSFLEAIITKEALESMKDPSLSEEANFIRLMEGIKFLVNNQFGEIDDAYLDYVTEEFYNNRFEA